LNLDVPPDYQTNPSQMPRPYVRFVMRSTQHRDNEGVLSFKDVVWAIVTAAGGKDSLEKVAVDWIQGLEDMAASGRVPAEWPSEYHRALAAFMTGQEIPVHGTPIKSWPPLTPAQREAVLHANCLTVEDLAAANDEMKGRIGMGSLNLVDLAKKWLAEASGPGVLAARIDVLTEQLAGISLRNQTLEGLVKEMTGLIPKDKLPTTVKPSGEVVLPQEK
jgi:hypothetical protein